MKKSSKDRKNNFAVWIEKFFWVLCLIVVAVIVALVINKGLSFSSASILLISLVLISLCVRHSRKIFDYFREHKRFMYCVCAVLMFLGIALRLSFLFVQGDFHPRQTLSDTGVHWYGAQQLVDNGGFDKEVGDYETVYPYLFTYTGSLALSMNIFGKSFLAVIMLNLFFDLLAAFCLFILFWKWKKSKTAGLFAATIWLINPFEILFCGLTLAIVVVNALMILATLAMYLVYSNRDSTGKLIVYSLLLGCVIAVGNAYRPFFVIFGIALVVYYVIYLLSKRVVFRNSVFSVVATFLMIVLVGLLPSRIHQSVNPYYHGGKSQAGWSIFVGAHYETSGKWSSDDRDFFFGPVLIDQANGDANEAYSIIMKQAIKRYGKMILEGKLVEHFFNKTALTFGDVRNAYYDIPYAYNISKESYVYNLVQDWSLVFYYSVLGLFIVFLFENVKNFWFNKKILPNSGFNFVMVISFVGFFFAMLMVESMNRYSLPFIALMVVFAVGYLVDVFRTSVTFERSLKR